MGITFDYHGATIADLALEDALVQLIEVPVLIALVYRAVLLIYYLRSFRAAGVSV